MTSTKSSETINIYLGNREEAIAKLYYNFQGNRESASFEYEQNWLKASDNFALEKNLPLIYGRHFHKSTNGRSIFPNIIADTEPDGWAKQVILRDHRKRSKSSKMLNSLDFLQMVDDFSRIGALRISNKDGSFTRSNLPPIIEIDKLMKATSSVESHSETLRDLAYLRGKATSLGGMRPKCTIIEEDGSLAIAKFPSIHDERSVTSGEVLALKLARAAGINAAKARLLSYDNIQIAVIKRFDRDNLGNRILYASAATLLGANQESNHLFTYKDIVDEIRAIGFHIQNDLEELWRRIAFSILINNVDDHLHNHGFLYKGNGNWGLSNAFDINPFPDKERSLKTWISEETGSDTSLEALFATTDYFQITLPRAKEMLEQIKKVLKNWRQEAKGLGMSSKDIHLFSQAFEI